MIREIVLSLALSTCMAPANIVDTVPDEQVIEQVQPELTSLGTYHITHYCACSKCCGKYANGYTASGTKATAGRTIGVNPKVIPYGTQVLIGDTWYTAEDTGVIKGNHIDIFCDSHQAALNAGVYDIEIYTGGQQ